MNVLDYTILVVIGLSALVGLLRGFVRETVSLLVWITAFWLAMTYGAEVAVYLSGYIHQPTVRVAAAFIGLFVAVILVGIMINYILAGLLKKAGLRTSDRILGVLFGVARGGLVVALVMVLVDLTPLVESHNWRESTIVELVHPILSHVHKAMPTGLHASVAQGFGIFSR